MEFNEENFNQILKQSEDLAKKVELLTDSVTKLEHNNQHLLNEKKEARKKAEQAEIEKQEEAQKLAKAAGDLEAYEKSWSEKLNKINSSHETEVNELKNLITSVTSGKAATDLANKIAVQGSAIVLLPHIESRLTTEIINGKPETKILDQDGKISALTLQDLEDEFKTNPAFAPLLLGSKSNGSGNISNNEANTHKKFSEMSSAELVQLHRTNPEKYQQLKSAG